MHTLPEDNRPEWHFTVTQTERQFIPNAPSHGTIEWVIHNNSHGIFSLFKNVFFFHIYFRLHRHLLVLESPAVRLAVGNPFLGDLGSTNSYFEALERKHQLIINHPNDISITQIDPNKTIHAASKIYSLCPGPYHLVGFNQIARVKFNLWPNNYLVKRCR